MDMDRLHDDDGMAPASEDSSSGSRWGFPMLLLWAALSAWITFQLMRGATFHDDGVALPALLLLITTAVLGSRLFVFLQDRTRHAT